MPMMPALTEEKRAPVFDRIEIIGSGLTIYMSNLRSDPVGYLNLVL
jgi:hypothetical protein